MSECVCVCVCVYVGGGYGRIEGLTFTSNIHCSSWNSDIVVMETTNQIAHPGLLNDVGSLPDPVEEMFLTNSHKHIPGVEGRG